MRLDGKKDKYFVFPISFTTVEERETSLKIISTL
jgi:hypothetical protein